MTRTSYSEEILTKVSEMSTNIEWMKNKLSKLESDIEEMKQQQNRWCGTITAVKYVVGIIGGAVIGLIIDRIR